MLTSGSYGERRGREIRLAVLRVGAMAVFAVLAVSFWLLQVVQHGRYRDMAENNRLRTISLRAPRGVMVDRDGRLLVENRYSFTIALVREQSTDLARAVREVARVTGADERRLADLLQRRRAEPMFRPIPLIEHATFEQVAAVTARRLELPEIVVQQVPTRTYPGEGLAAHLFGYVSEIQGAQIDRPEFAGLPAGAIVGQSGLEKAYNAHLMGRDGNRWVVVNSRGREIEELRQEHPVDGHPIQVTIDLDLQRALEEAFHARGFAGAAVLLAPATGEVLALTSLPAYDPNDFAGGIDGRTWSSLTSDPLRPLTNRLTQGMYSPGSTFKIAMAVAGLAEGVITPEHRTFCPGHATLYGHTFRCNRPAGHGWVDLRQAIAQSCNVYFYQLGDRLRIDTIHEYAAKLGLVGRTGIDLPGESESLVPSTAWKRRVTGERWYPGETISVAIGQGQVSVTPIALATMIATVANGGTPVTPHLLKAVGDGAGWRPVPPPPPAGAIAIRPEHLEAIRDGLWEAVNGTGTAGSARLPGRDVSGKTGTAQVISREGSRVAAGRATTRDLRDHGWFVFFAPRERPEIAGVILAEHGERGSAAAPIAKAVLETYFAKRDGLTPPAAATPAAAPASGVPGPAASARVAGGPGGGRD